MAPGETKKSAPRNADAIRAFLASLPTVLGVCGIRELVVVYGYGCEIHPDLWYKPMAIQVPQLLIFLERSVDQGIFIPGYSDLSICTSSASLVLDVSHEGRVDVSGSDLELVSRVLADPAVAETGVARPGAGV
jgi:hypothetical protein